MQSTPQGLVCNLKGDGARRSGLVWRTTHEHGETFSMRM